MQKITRFLGSPAGLILRHGVSLMLIGIIAMQVEWGTLADLRARLDGPLLLAALTLALLTLPVCSLRWWMLLKTVGAGLPFARAHAITWAGQFYNAFLPGGIGGDATRLVMAFRDRPDRRAAAAAAIIADRAIGFAVLLALAAGALALHSGSQASSPMGRIVLALAGAVTLALAAGAWFLPSLVAPRLPPVWKDAVVALRSDARTGLAATALSVGVWVLDFASGWCLAHSLGLPFGVLAISAALGLAYLSTILPISLGGHGIREGSLVLALLWLDEPGRTGSADLAAFALLFLTISLISSLVGGVVLLLMGRERAQPPPSESSS